MVRHSDVRIIVFLLMACTGMLLVPQDVFALYYYGGSDDGYSSGSYADVDVYTSSATWVCPTGVTAVDVEVWGAGGAGGGSASTSGAGGGGGGGAYSKKGAIAVTPGNSYTVSVGTGGTGSTGDGTNGGDSYFINASTVMAKGGSGGHGYATGQAGGAGGDSSLGAGEVKTSGGTGYTGAAVVGGGGGGSGGSGSNGNNATSQTGATAVTGGDPGGDGGGSKTNGSLPSGSGGGGGGGGVKGGATSTNGGTGATGRVVINRVSSGNFDGTLTSAGGVTEPVAISSIVDTSGERVAVFDFTISDGGTSDGKALGVSQIVLHTSGTGTPGDLTWQINGPDASYVTGTVAAGTITFSSLSISVANGGSETYTVYAYFSTDPASTDGQTFILSVDGDTDLTLVYDGTQMGSTSAVNNGTGSTMNVVHTQLSFTTQPPAGAFVNQDFTGTIVASGTDVNGNVDTAFTENVTISAVKDSDHSAGSGTLSSTDSGGLTKAATSGSATWTDTKYSTQETIDIKAVSATYASGIYSTAVEVGQAIPYTGGNDDGYSAVDSGEVALGGGGPAEVANAMFFGTSF